MLICLMLIMVTPQDWQQAIANVNYLQVMDGCHSKVVNMVSSVPQGSVLGLQLFLQYTVKFSSYFKTGFVDSTFVDVVPAHHLVRE